MRPFAPGYIRVSPPGLPWNEPTDVMGSRGSSGVRAVRESPEGGVDHLLGETSGVTLMSHTEGDFASTIGVNSCSW